MYTPSEFVINQEQLGNFLGPVQGALGGLPVAEQLQDYFLVFQQAGGTGPEIIDETAYFITYMVDSKGNVAKPLDDYPSQNNLIQNFGVGSNVIVRNDAATSFNSQLGGIHQVSAIGRQQPILYTQKGFDTGSHVTKIIFLSSDGVGLNAESEVPYFLGGMLAPDQITTDNSVAFPGGDISMTNYDEVEVPTPDATAAVFSATAGTYTFDSSATPSLSLQSLTFQVDGTLRNYADYAINVTVKIKREGTTPGQYFTVEEKTYSVPGVSSTGPNAEDSAGVPYSPLNIGSDPLIYTIPSPPFQDKKYIVTVGTTYWSQEIFQISSLSFRAISQNPAPTTPVDTGGTSIGFSTGSSYQDFTSSASTENLCTWLTASSFVSQGWGYTQDSSNVLQNQESNLAGVPFNLSPIETPFLPKVGDRIRFEYNKATDYFIYDVITPNLDPQNRLKLKINQVVPPAVERENYIIHRTNIADPTYIILNVNKNDSIQDTQNFNGLILPEFPTDELKNNLDQITIDLKERGIITDNEA